MALFEDGTTTPSAPLSPPPAPKKRVPVKRFSDNFYCWDEQDGFRIYSMTPGVRPASFARPIQKPVPLRIPMTTVSDPKRSHADKKCVCGNPEPVLEPALGRADSGKAFTGPALHRREGSAVSFCICKFSPKIEQAETVIVHKRTRARIVSHDPFTALPPMKEVDEPAPVPAITIVEKVDDNEDEKKQSSRKSRGNSTSSFSRLLNVINPSSSQRTTPHPRGLFPPLSASATLDAFSSRSPSHPNPNFSTARDLERNSDRPRGTRGRLRSSIFHWHLIILISNLLLFGTILFTTLVLIWPAIEQAPFPHTTYGYAPHVVSITDHSFPMSSGQQGVENKTSVRTTVEVATLGTVGVPEGVMNKEAAVKVPQGYFAHGAFIRTFHAEFRKRGFPALVAGLSIFCLAQLVGSVFSAVCLGRKLEQKDQWAACSNEKGCFGWLGSRFRNWSAWKRSGAWDGHRGQCVEAARVKGMFVLLRCLYVVLVVGTCAVTAQWRCTKGEAAP